ncbi:hypothetical protein [Streptomyces kronopolitis]
MAENTGMITHLRPPGGARSGAEPSISDRPARRGIPVTVHDR